MCGHRDLRCAAHLDLHRVPAAAVLYDGHAGVPFKPGDNGGGCSGRNTDGEAFEEIYRLVNIGDYGSVKAGSTGMYAR